MKDAHFDAKANTHNVIWDLAREELGERQMLGLLRPSEHEIELVNANVSVIETLDHEHYR